MKLRGRLDHVCLSLFHFLCHQSYLIDSATPGAWKTRISTVLFLAISEVVS
jgi:hypothetical protein